MNSKLDYKAGIMETLPTVFGYVGIGLAYGIIGKAEGLNFITVVLFSMLIYAGSSQFIIISMMVLKSPVLSIMFATFLVNSRMILMSMKIAPYFKEESFLKNVLIGTFLTDESFALGISKLNFTNNKLNFSWFNASNIISYLTWAISSGLGYSIGSFIGNPEKFGLDFAMIAMFIGLLYLQIKSDLSMPFNLQITMVIITFVLIFLGLIFIPSNLLIILVTIIACGIGVLIKDVFK